MNPEYKALRQHADELFHRCNDVMDDKGAGGGILNGARQIVEEFEMSKNPHTIEDQVKTLIEELHALDGNSQAVVMDYGHAEELRHDYESLRESIRHLSNY